MAGKKVIFVAFAIEDERIRDMIKGQSLHTNTPFEYIDMSVACAQEVGVPVRGIWAHKEDHTRIAGVKTMDWTWDNIGNWIDSL